MKHAVMIMAHKDVDQLKRLINSLSNDDFHVFVHLDSKMKVTDSDKKELLDCSNDVSIVDERINGSLDSWTLIEIELSLIRLAKKAETIKNVHYSYYLLLSGQDYPIKDHSYILKFLENNYPKPFIDCTPHDRSNWVYHKFKVVGIHKVRKYINSNVRNSILRTLIKIPIHVWGRIQAWMNKNIFTYGYKLYGGSQWWVLPDKVIDFIINEMESNVRGIKKFKKTTTPDETFFQIMTMASPLSSIVDVNPKDMVAQNCMTYANFSVDGKPFTGHPYIFIKEDFKKIKELPNLFARKFDINIDSEIIDMIDQINKRELSKTQ